MHVLALFQLSEMTDSGFMRTYQNAGNLSGITFSFGIVNIPVE